MIGDDPTDLNPPIPAPTRRDLRVERDRRRPSWFRFGWFAYSVVVLVITAAAAELAVSAGR